MRKRFSLIKMKQHELKESQLRKITGGLPVGRCVCECQSSVGNKDTVTSSDKADWIDT
jgi:hypothetical protein